MAKFFATKWIVIGALTLFMALPCSAVIVYSDPGRLTAPPTGKLADSGWQYEGEFQGFTGTPIGPDYFITASHIGGSVGSIFTLNDARYTTTAFYDDPNTDLRIWKIDGTFPAFAPLYTKKGVNHKKIVVFGRGTDRGSPVTLGNKFKGWQWGAADSSLSWGTNNITASTNFGGDIGNVLEFKFNGKKSKPDEASISAGDSGGGVFIKVHKTWELAGVNYSTDGPFSFDSNPANEFSASLIDQGGLYTFNDKNQPIFIRDVAANKPSINYATRINTEADWINSVLAGDASPGESLAASFSNTVPEPGEALLVLPIFAYICGRQRRDHSAKQA